MGLETATYIADLVATNPVGATDAKSEGDNHLRLIKAALQASFPNMATTLSAYLAAPTGLTTFNFLTSVATTVNLATGASVALTIGNAAVAASFPGGISIPTGKNVTGTGTATVTGFATVSATTLTGTLSTAAQPNVTSVGTLTGLAAGGNTGAYGFTFKGGTGSGNGAYLAFQRNSVDKGYVGNDAALNSNDTADFAVMAIGNVALYSKSTGSFVKSVDISGTAVSLGSLSLTAGAISGTTGAFSTTNALGGLTLTASTGTNASTQQFINTGGTYSIGVDNSTGSNFGSIYAMVINAPTGRVINTTINATEVTRVSSTGLAVTGTLNTTGRASIQGSGTTSASYGLVVTNSTPANAFWVRDDGHIAMLRLPTSSAGLASGEIWANSNVLTVVP